MKSKIITGGVMVLLTMAFGCKKEDYTYKGPSVIEFSNPPGNVNTRTIYTANAPVVDSALIQLIGAQVSTETKIGWDTTTTTAVLPTDVQPVGTYGQASIPANSSHGKIAFTLQPTAAGKKLVLVLKDGDVKASVNAKTMTFNVTAVPVDWFLTGTTLTKTVKPTATTGNDTIRVRITAAAARFKQAVTFDYTIKAGSTAVEGTDFTFVTPKGKATIPAGGGDAVVVVKFNPVTASKKLDLLLSSAPGISVPAARNTFSFTVNP
ncbi:hypothetical protein [Chitinophaga lutea]|nr:hypothetical protein [Chitinophaga lutea]